MRINKKILLLLYSKGENTSNKRNNKAVSEIIATILLISISSHAFMHRLFIRF